MLKQVLNFILEEMLLPQSNRFKPYMQEVVPFLARLNKKLGQCVSSFPNLSPPAPRCPPSLLLLHGALFFPTLIRCPSHAGS